MRIGTRILWMFAFMAVIISAMAQPNTETDLKKPKGLEEHKLGSEKMADKKFTKSRHLFQNLYTHYNYYYNANRILNNIIDRAKSQNRDNYAMLLPFYNYTLDATAKSSDIDTVINKCTAGILLHDLRNDWVDNLYLLIGRAYLLRKNYDTAAMVFQYVNFAFAPTEKNGYKKIIGSNSTEGGSTLSIASKDNSNIFKKAFTSQPSRDESFIWQIRTFTETQQYLDAASLITTLKGDPIFPKRLSRQLAEIEAYNYYRQQQYDSSAKYLSQAITLAENNVEKARWYYLVGQMYQTTNQPKLAADYFSKCVNTATDPVMEVYARLAVLRLRKNDDPNAIQNNISEMLKLAKKERFDSYRDIIFYAAALSELERNGYENAEKYLRKSIQYNEGEPVQRSKSFLLLGDIAFGQKKFSNASLSYDSVLTNTLDSSAALVLIGKRPACHTIYQQERIIHAQDSLQNIALMPTAERNIFVKALAKKLRKAQGLKEEEVMNTGLVPNATQTGKGPTDIFGGNQTGSGDSYFNNQSIKASGFTQFKQNWGTRPNVDNWRRSDAIQLTTIAQPVPNPLAIQRLGINGKPLPKLTNIQDVNSIYKPTDISYAALYANLPVSVAQLKLSNTTINEAMLAEAKAMENQLEDFPEAIKVYEALLVRLNKEPPTEEVLFNLVYCYSKTGDLAKMEAIKSRLNTTYKDSSFTKKMNTPIVDPQHKDPAATAKYKEIYNQFIEGNFEKAAEEKRKADSIYKDNYWTPQLLYIEAVYYIKQKEDGSALQELTNIITKFPGIPLAIKAKAVIDVLKRRKEIEDYLTKLKVHRNTDDSTDIVLEPTPIITPTPVIAPDTATGQRGLVKKTPAIVKDNVATTAIPKPSSTTKKPILSAGSIKTTSLVITKKDTTTQRPVPKAPTALAKKDTIANVKQPAIVKNDTTKTKPIVNEPKLAKKDTTIEKPVVKTPIAVVPQKDTASKLVRITNNPFIFNPDAPQMAVVLLNKVDIVYINECKNAFDRYNQVNIYSQKFVLDKIKLSADYSMVTINAPEFTSAAKTMEYVNMIKPKATSQIVPWLEAYKFSIIIISQANLDLLKQNMDVPGYLKIMKAAGY